VENMIILAAGPLEPRDAEPSPITKLDILSVRDHNDSPPLGNSPGLGGPDGVGRAASC